MSKAQHAAKRAIEVAAAGGHNLLMIGPPGSGKSMLAKRIPTIMPPMSFEEVLETTKIHSICGYLAPKRAFINLRPFRSPHHTISDAGLLGGGSNPSPGEVTLAHNGIVDHSTRVWRGNESQIDASREARAALQIMAADARTLLRSAGLTVVHLPENDRLALLTLLPGHAQRTGNRGDLCTVGYFVAYDRPSRFTPAGQSSRNLYRYLRGSDETFARLEAGEDLFAEFEEVAAMTTPSRHRNVVLLARNVNGVNFEALALSPEGDPVPAETTTPAAVSVKVRVVPTQHALRLANENDWNSLPDESQITSSTLFRIP